MLIYSDGYSIAINDSKKNVMINFLQSTPHISESTGEIESITQEPVAGITMNSEKAAGLCRALERLLSQE